MKFIENNWKEIIIVLLVIAIILSVITLIQVTKDLNKTKEKYGDGDKCITENTPCFLSADGKREIHDRYGNKCCNDYKCIRRKDSLDEGVCTKITNI